MSDSSISVREAGQRGGVFFSEIGKMGGEAVREKYGPEHYAMIGRKGGESHKATPGYFSTIARKPRPKRQP